MSDSFTAESHDRRNVQPPVEEKFMASFTKMDECMIDGRSCMTTTIVVSVFATKEEAKAWSDRQEQRWTYSPLVF